MPDTTPPETRIDDRPPDPDTHTTATFRFSGTDDAPPPAALGFECELGPGTDVLNGAGRDRCVTGEVSRSCP